MRRIPSLLVFIQDDLSVLVHESGTVYPHITLRTGGSSVTVYEDRCLICLDHMIVIKLLMKIIVQDFRLKATLDAAHG